MHIKHLNIYVCIKQLEISSKIIFILFAPFQTNFLKHVKTLVNTYMYKFNLKSTYL